jgi:hypothetical protein
MTQGPDVAFIEPQIRPGLDRLDMINVGRWNHLPDLFAKQAQRISRQHA